MILTRPTLSGIIGPAVGFSFPVLFDFEADTLVLSDNDPVATWPDDGPNNNDATQGTGGAQPTYKATAGPGGRPCVHFDGGDFLTLSSTTSVFTDLTCFAVCKPAGGGDCTFFSGAASSPQYRISSNDRQTFLKAGVLAMGNSNTSLSTSAFQQINAKVGTAALLFRMSSASDGPTSFNGATFTVGIDTIGAKPGPSERFSGDLCMLRVYSGQLLLSEIQTIEAQIASRWGVT